MLLRQGSDVYRVNGMATLQRWIVQLRVDRDDRLSTGDDSWERLGDIAELKQFFEVVDRARASREDAPTESLSGSPSKPTIPFLPDPRAVDREEPTEESTVDTTWEGPLSGEDLIPDPSLFDVAPIRPPADLEPEVSDESFLNEDKFFAESQAATRSEPEAVDPEDDVEWRSGSSSNTWIAIGVVVAALLLLLWVEPWASDEVKESPSADLSASQPPVVEPAEAAPAAAPEPTEDPDPSAEAEPTAAPEPAPTAAPEPAPTTAPEPAPTAAPEPAPVESAEPVAVASPAEVVPVAAPAPAASSAPDPDPEPDPAPAAATSSVSDLVAAGWSAIDSGQFSKARGLFNQALDAQPGHAESRFGLGYAFEKLGDTETALRQYCRTLQGAYLDVATQREVEGRLRAMKRECG